MTKTEAISYFEKIIMRCNVSLSHCQSKQNRLPEEEKNIKKKRDAATFAIRAIKNSGMEYCSSESWKEDLWKAEWGD